eukprot:5844780-Amphidinium_carterae.1
MLSKNKRHVDEDAPGDKRLRSNILDLYGSGRPLSATRAASLLNNAADAGLGHLQEKGLGTGKANRSREVRKAMLKSNLWPELFTAPIRLKGAGDEEVVEEMHFLLPHEVLQALWVHSDQTLMVSDAGLDSISRTKLAGIRAELCCDMVIALGLWLDGVPMYWDRSESLFCFTFNLPGLSAAPYAGMRFPFTTLPKHLCSKHTVDDVLRVFSWSLSVLSVGSIDFRPDAGDPVALQGKLRCKMAGKVLGFRGCLLHLKGDWEAFANLLHLPRWDNTADICFKCKVLRASLLDVEFSASWRQPAGRILPSELLTHLIQQGRAISPVWGFPHFDGQCFQLDWLHVVDQGVAQTFLGSLLVSVVCRPGVELYGLTQEIRRHTIFGFLSEWYKRNKIFSDRLKPCPWQVLIPSHPNSR